MPRVSLTDRFCSGAKAKDVPQVDFFDEGTPGLALRVASGGHKAWTFIFTSPKDGKRARAALGSYPATTLAAARTRATEARSLVEAGQDPRDVFAAQAAGAMTVKMLLQSYLEKHVRPNLRSAKEIERRFERNVIPVIGAMTVAELHKRDINRAVDPILQRGRPIEASRCFEDLRALLRWAVARGDLDRNPMEGMQKPATSTPGERVLSDEEIRTLWLAMPEALAKSKATQRVIKLCLITAQRIGEVSGMRRSELDVKARTWSLPGSRVKNGHAHQVHLSDLAIAIIREALADIGDDDEFLFPNLDGDGPVPPTAVERTIGRAQERIGVSHWSSHDLRRSAVTGMAKLGVAPIVLGHVINHRSVTKAGVTLSTYAHYDYSKEKISALDLWASRIEGIISDAAKVVPMHRGART
jgi:integrase